MPASPLLGYRRLQRRRRGLLLGLLLGVLCSLLVDMAVGPASLDLATLWRGVWQPGSLDAGQHVIIWQLRLPHALMAVLVGAALGLAGAEMQTVLNNPLASPFTLGVSAAATLGASLVLLAGWSVPGVPPSYVLPLAAFAGAGLATLLLLGLLRYLAGHSEQVILLGIALLFSCEALVALLQFGASSDALQQVVFWTFGSLARASWDKLLILLLVLLPCLGLAMRQAWVLNSLRLGEEQAQAAGIDVARLRRQVLLRVSLLAAVAVCFVGSIGFIGLLAPHCARLLLGEHHRYYLPGSALWGALLLSLAALASKGLVSGLVLPVGIVTALVGIPLLLLLLLWPGRSA